jgi:hypothetical protein
MKELYRLSTKRKVNNVHVSPHVITQVGHKILSSAAQPHLQKTAVEAAGQFASYRSSLLPLPVTYLTTLTATPTEPKGPPISVGLVAPNLGVVPKQGVVPSSVLVALASATVQTW